MANSNEEVSRGVRIREVQNQDARPAGTTRRRLLQSTAIAAGAVAASQMFLKPEEGLAQNGNGPAPGEAWKVLYPKGFENHKVQTSGGVTINCVTGGDGPPLLMFHGAPQSLVTWHIIAPDLAKEYSLVMCDLRGYGDSEKPEGAADHSTYSKRVMAQDGVDVMKHFGYDEFRMVGHDRGGRVGRRMALDHPEKIQKLAVLDIVPAHWLYSHVTLDFVRAYSHWFTFLLPNAETTNGGRGGAPKGAPKGGFKGGKGKGGDPNSPAAIVQAEYARHNANPAMQHAMYEDYRASASIDLINDNANIAMGHTIQCPVQTLWAANGAMGRMYDVLGIWKEEAGNIIGKGLPGNHSLQESAPAETLAELQAFLRD